MKRFALTIAGTLTLVGLAVTASADTLTAAQKQALSQRMSCINKRMTSRLLRLDANKDGKIDRDEHKSARAARVKAMLHKYDADGDGKLSETERQQKHHDRLVARFEQLDSNGDAEISSAEAALACGSIKHHFAKVDADSNGVVTWTEFEAAAKQGRHRFGGRHGHHGKGHWGKGQRHGPHTRPFGGRGA